MSVVRNYPVPRPVALRAPLRVTSDRLHDLAAEAAACGRVRGYQLPVLASGSWPAGAEWATAVLEREAVARDRRARALLAAIGYDPTADTVYHGVLDSAYPDHELIVSVVRSEGADSDLERWDGLDWGRAEVDEDGLEYVLLDESVLADVLDAINTGSAGVALRPFNPKAWVRDCPVVDYPVLAAGAPPRHTGAMVALPIDPELAQSLAVEGGEAPEDMHVTLAYLGDTQEDQIDYEAVQRAVARWARRMSPMNGEISGPAKFTAGEKPVSVALADVPDLPAARELLVRFLEAEGVEVNGEHGYTPHITLAYDDRDVDVPNAPLSWDTVRTHYADDVQEYPLGEPVVAAGGAGPDTIYAIVDEFDTSAVLDIVKVLPGPVAYRRSGGAWVKDHDLLMRLMGVDPPPVVVVTPDQTQDVVSQVDSYDKENPPAADPVTAAIGWNELLHPRAGGKFAKKEGGAAQQPAKDTKRGPKRSGKSAVDILGRRPTAAELKAKPWLALGLGNDKNFNDLDMGLGGEFWKKTPKGFRNWAIGFLNRKRGEDQAGKAGDWKKDVPAQYRRAMNQFTEAIGVKAEHPHRGPVQYNKDGSMDHTPEKLRARVHGGKAGAKSGRGDGKFEVGKASGGSPFDHPSSSSRDTRIAGLDKADAQFDVGFAKEGLAEAQRREEFDRKVAHTAERLLKSGANPQAIERVMRKKVMEERRRRNDFERARKVAAEKERVRRMEARNAEKDKQNKEDGVTAAADPPSHSMMPGNLKEFWARGKGAAKIRWGTSGDFKRCERALRKYLHPEQVAGACANMHKLATGSWPGPSNKHH